MLKSHPRGQRCTVYSTTTGILVAAHGVSHADRALLALMFEERFEGELPLRESDYKAALRGLLTLEQVWWTRYLGKIAMMIARMYPAGGSKKQNRECEFRQDGLLALGKHGNKEGLEVKFTVAKRADDPYLLKDTMIDLLRVVERVGGGKNGG